MTAEQDHARKIAKLSVYLGYSDAGKALLYKIRAYATKHKTPISTLVLDALKKTYPDLGL